TWRCEYGPQGRVKFGFASHRNGSSSTDWDGGFEKSGFPFVDAHLGGVTFSLRQDKHTANEKLSINANFT
uniref:Uncharacterized protein n=1 Tax=Anopheles atroparvus TaxID=41427 RepID=A0AAG5D5P8_ANOAO